MMFLRRKFSELYTNRFIPKFTSLTLERYFGFCINLTHKRWPFNFSTFLCLNIAWISLTLQIPKLSLGSFSLKPNAETKISFLGPSGAWQLKNFNNKQGSVRTFQASWPNYPHPKICYTLPITWTRILCVIYMGWPYEESQGFSLVRPPHLS